MGDTIDQRSCFTGAGAGNDEERAVSVSCSLGLLRVQLGREVARSVGSNDAFARRIVVFLKRGGGIVLLVLLLAPLLWLVNRRRATTA